MRLPRLIKMQGFDFAIKHGFDGVGVVHHAIVGALREREDFWFACFVLNQGMRIDFCLYGFHQKLGLWNRSDDAVVVARRREEHRNRTCHDNRMQV